MSEDDHQFVWRAHLLERAPVLEGADVVWAEPAYDPDSDVPVTRIWFTPRGAATLARAMRANRGKRMAVVLDDKVKAVFVIDAEPDGDRLVLPAAPERSAQGERDVLDLVGALRAGIPLPIELRSSRLVGRRDDECSRVVAQMTRILAARRAQPMPPGTANLLLERCRLGWAATRDPLRYCALDSVSDETAADCIDAIVHDVVRATLGPVEDPARRASNPLLDP